MQVAGTCIPAEAGWREPNASDSSFSSRHCCWAALDRL